MKRFKWLLVFHSGYLISTKSPDPHQVALTSRFPASTYSGIELFRHRVIPAPKFPASTYSGVEISTSSRRHRVRGHRDVVYRDVRFEFGTREKELPVE